MSVNDEEVSQYKTAPCGSCSAITNIGTVSHSRASLKAASARARTFLPAHSQARLSSKLHSSCKGIFSSKRAQLAGEGLTCPI